MEYMSGDGSSPPSVSGGIQLRVLPTGPGPFIPVVWTCSDGESPFHQIPGNVTAWRIILYIRSVSFLGPCHSSRRTPLRASILPLEEGTSSAALRLPSATLHLPTFPSSRVWIITVCVVDVSPVSWSQCRDRKHHNSIGPLVGVAGHAAYHHQVLRSLTLLLELFFDFQQGFRC